MNTDSIPTDCRDFSHMLISHRKRFIYTKTAKTAGTSVESYFEKYCMPEDAWEFSHEREEYVSNAGIIGYRGSDHGGKKWHNHMSAKDIKEKTSDVVWNTYFKFCVVRDPFDKLVSGFYYFFTKQENDCSKMVHWKYWVKTLLGKTNAVKAITRKRNIEQFRNWILSGGSFIDRDRYMINGDICVDYVIRYEQLQEGIKYVCTLLEIPFEPEEIPTLKVGMRDKNLLLSDYYDERTIKIVSDLYRVELEKFGYHAPTVYY